MMNQTGGWMNGWTGGGMALLTVIGTFHRLRQSGIDEELFDVISGFEALVGPR